jgi:hypothetical protein
MLHIWGKVVEFWLETHMEDVYGRVSIIWLETHMEEVHGRLSIGNKKVLQK